MAAHAASAGAEAPKPATAAADAYFRADPVKLAELKSSKPWMQDVKWFTKVKISAAAAMKMTTHAQSGVDKGLKGANAMPVEVMGLMHGHVDTDDPHAIIVTDAFPLPVEGTETTVMSDNPAVTNYMIQLSETLESVRSESFMGWYHSHPFDIGVHSNAFLSATDVSTQLAWQLSEDRAGNPWLALVVDPLTSLARGRPEIGAFRCYPPSHVPPKGVAPDGTVWADEKARDARWGVSCLSYYQLGVEYFTSGLAGALLGTLAAQFSWARALGSTPSLEAEAVDRAAAALKTAAGRADSAAHRASTALEAATHPAPGGGGGMGSHHHHMGMMLRGGGGGGGGGGPASMSALMGEFRRTGLGGGGSGGGDGGSVGGAVVSAATGDLREAISASTALSTEVARAQVSQLVKNAVFNGVDPAPPVTVAAALRAAVEAATGELPARRDGVPAAMAPAGAVARPAAPADAAAGGGGGPAAAAGAAPPAAAVT